jgi:hypothetical protein
MENAQSIRQRMTVMAKMFFSLGFWMTIVLFVGLGYVFGAEFPDAIDYRAEMAATEVSWSPHEQSSPLQQYQDQEDIRANDIHEPPGCMPNATPTGNNSMFPQMANWERGGSMYAPGLSLSISEKPSQMSLCPGPVEIPSTD